MSSSSPPQTPPASSSPLPPPILTIHNRYPIYLQEDWSSGIGGGLWSTGLALAHYFASDHFFHQFTSMTRRRRMMMMVATSKSSTITSSSSPDPNLRILELGSGNGFLSVCMVLALQSHWEKTKSGGIGEGDSDATPLTDSLLPQIIATDTAEHLTLMQTTIDSNLKRCLGLDVAGTLTGRMVSVREYLWGDKTNQLVEDAKERAFDLIVGSDLAYRDDLHDPLIAALGQFSVTGTTVTILGVTMTDTKPIFFHKLLDAGFRYERLADHLLTEQFRGAQFGVFIIWKENEY